MSMPRSQVMQAFQVQRKQSCVNPVTMPQFMVIIHFKAKTVLCEFAITNSIL